MRLDGRSQSTDGKWAKPMRQQKFKGGWWRHLARRIQWGYASLNGLEESAARVNWPRGTALTSLGISGEQ